MPQGGTRDTPGWQWDPGGGRRDPGVGQKGPREGGRRDPGEGWDAPGWQKGPRGGGTRDPGGWQGQDRSSLLPPRQTGGFCHFPPLHNQGWGKPVANYSLENTLLFKASRSFPSAPGQHHPQVYGEGTLLQPPSSLDLILHPPQLSAGSSC